MSRLITTPQTHRVHVEAGVCTGVAGGRHRCDGHQQGVTVAIEGSGAHVEVVAGGVALAPVLPAGTGPEGDQALGEGAAHCLLVHPAQHEHVSGVALLDYGGKQAIRGEHGPFDDGVQFVRVHRVTSRTSTPAAASSRLTSPTVNSALWKTDAANTASAPAATAGAKCSSAPAPPLAMSGTVLTSRIAWTSSRSNPCLVPSASMEFTRSSPAPRSIASRAQASPSRSVSVRPPWVVTTNPEGTRADRFRSSESTSACAPNRSAISESSSGRAIAALFTPTLSAPAPCSRATSSTLRTPPPTVSGMKTCSAVALTTSYVVDRLSTVAVTSRKVISSAPCS